MEYSIGGFEAERRGFIAWNEAICFLPGSAGCRSSRKQRPLGNSNQADPSGRSHNLSSYDATYLDLALRKSATLASFDRRLI
jgi:hypothetical protein